MSFTLIKNVKIINENQIFESDILIDGCYIKKISKSISAENNFNIVEGGGKYLIPGVIDDQVHFREPGLTHKANIKSESKSALAGGVTSFMEMPNTNPQTINQDLLNKKLDIAKNTSFVNYSFFGGVTNTNYDDVMRFDKTQIPGIKIFMG
ncbi:MAG: dihydroorotase, partial [Flavobacteriales bacterium]|nr:dihydroorotase [Flavobacteriales bacterium]